MSPNPKPWWYNLCWLLVSIFHQTPYLFWINFFEVKSNKTCGMLCECILKTNIYILNLICGIYFSLINLVDLTFVLLYAHAIFPALVSVWACTFEQDTRHILTACLHPSYRQQQAALSVSRQMEGRGTGGACWRREMTAQLETGPRPNPPSLRAHRGATLSTC